MDLVYQSFLSHELGAALSLQFLKGHETAFERLYDRLGAILDLKLGKNLSHVRLNRFLADEQPIRDFFVGLAQRQMPEHLNLAPREIVMRC